MPAPVWTFAELEALFAVEVPGGLDLSGGVGGVSIDTRTLSPGDLFVAIDGREAGGRDGHDFIGEAIDAGAAAVMAHRDIAAAAVPVLRAQGTGEGLRRLGDAARRRHRGKVVGVTGSGGKTTLRAWLETLLAPFGKTHASQDSYNNQWGVPLSLARMPADARFGVFEIGTNHPGEIAPLAKLVAPDVAVLLNVLPAHVGNFADMRALTAEKLSIAQGLVKDGVMVLPATLARRLPARVRRVSFGPGGDVDGEIAPMGASATVSVKVDGDTFDLSIPFSGEHRLQSALASVAILKCLNLDPRAAGDAFARLPLPAGRGGAQTVNGITIIDDSYNANPVSMGLAIDSLKASAGGGEKIALLGEILELGREGPAAHQKAARACRGLDRVYSFGGGFAGADFGPRHQGHYATVDEFDDAAFAQTLKPGDVVLVKGSNNVFWKKGFVAMLLERLGGKS